MRRPQVASKQQEVYAFLCAYMNRLKLKNMRKIVFIIGLLVCSWVYAQDNVPDWYNPQMRAMVYPLETYFAGFVTGEIQNNETVESAYNRLKVAVRAEAISSIRISIEHTIDQKRYSTGVTTKTDFNETVYETFLNSTKMHSVIEDIPGLQIEVWRQPQTNTVAAFAWVKKSNACSYYKKQIQLSFGKIRSALSVAEYLESSGEKMKAKTELEKVESEMQNADKALAWLPVFGYSDESLSELIEERNELEQTYKQKLGSLSHATSIYISCKAEKSGQDYPNYENIIKGELNDMDVNFVDSLNAADWTIKVTCKSREYNKQTIGQVTSYFAFVEASLSIQKMTTKQIVYEDLISVKGSHTLSYDEAVRAAYKELNPKLGEIIKTQIQH